MKKLRPDTEDAKSNAVVINSDSEDLANDFGTENKMQLQQNSEELNTYDSNKPHGIVRSPVEETVSSPIDQVINGVGDSPFFEQTRTVDCPVCQVPVPADAINDHLDHCLA